MKKVILTLLVTIIFLGTKNAKANVNLPEDWPKITITIEIGLQPACTTNWSICKVDIGIGFLAGSAELIQATDDGKSTGHGGGGGGGGSWMINISRENFAKYYPGYLPKMDNQTSVTFESTYRLPDNVKKALGSVNDLVIQGQVAYPLKYENGFYTITFPIQ
ncbi:MAG: hypothetical protein WBB31_13420 [Saprospiraceae bacterium]